MGYKNRNIKQGDRAHLFIPFDSSRRASHFSVFVCQNWIKNGQVMTMQSAPKWRWLFYATRWQFWPHCLRYNLQTYFAQLLDQY